LNQLPHATFTSVLEKEASVGDIAEDRIVRDENRKKATRLLAIATIMLEDAMELAAKGQSSWLDPG